MRTWEHKEHLRYLSEAKWEPMFDPNGNELDGIEGSKGVRGTKLDGTHIGADFVRMQPGAKFPLHTHEGEHELYVISGYGCVHIDGLDIIVTAGAVIHIPAEYAHNVWVPLDAEDPLVFVAVGHPHKAVHSHDRMQLTESHYQAHRTLQAGHSHET